MGVCISTYNHRFSSPRGVIQLFYGGEKCIKVHKKNGLAIPRLHIGVDYVGHFLHIHQ